MVPKKPKEIVKLVSEELDLPQSFIDDVVTFYYKSLRKKLTDLEDINYKIQGLGEFVARSSGVKKSIRKFENMKKGMDSTTFMNYHNTKLVEARLEKLYSISKKIEVFLEKKKKFKQEKYGK